MAYDGWIEFGGAEFINLSRTAQLAPVLGIDTLWTDPESVQWIQDALGGVDYDSVTQAPWYDAGVPASMEFAGIVPLSIVGLDDSTLEATTIEYIGSGGSSGRGRSKTLPIVANVAIIASTGRGADFGKRWMDRRLAAAGARTFCSGSELRYFQYAQGDGEAVPPQVHRRDVTLTRGSSVTRKRNASCSVTWLVTFTWTANDPFEYGDEVPVITGLGGDPDSPGTTLMAVNLVPNPAFRVSTSGWLSDNMEFNRVASSGVQSGFVGEAMSIGWTAGQSVRAPSTPVTAGEDFTGSVALKPIGDVPAYLLRLAFYNDGAFVSSSTSVGILPAALSSTEFRRFSITRTVPATANSVRIEVFPNDPLDVGSGVQIGDAMVTEAAAAQDYFDGDTPDGIGNAYEWTGAPNDSSSIWYQSLVLLSSGALALTEQPCPVYDYSPIYDPLYPALVASPTAPDFYPAGWDLLPGMTFDRFWVRVASVEPSALHVVPVVTLTADVDARFVRVSIWGSDSPNDDQCDPLWTAIVSYLPAGLDFVIDGEQEASYAWDGVSTQVRRTDSLVYGAGARPIQWTKFNDPTELLITLDILDDTGSGDYDGNGTVRAAVAFVPKSD